MNAQIDIDLFITFGECNNKMSAVCSEMQCDLFPFPISHFLVFTFRVTPPFLQTFTASDQNLELGTVWD